MRGQREEPLSVNNVVHNSPSKSSKEPNKKSVKGWCYRYGQEGYYGRDKFCQGRRAECSKCIMVGHYAATCKTKTRVGAANSLGGRKQKAEGRWHRCWWWSFRLFYSWGFQEKGACINSSVKISWLYVELVVSQVILRITCKKRSTNEAMEVEAYGVCFLSYS